MRDNQDLNVTFTLIRLEFHSLPLAALGDSLTERIEILANSGGTGEPVGLTIVLPAFGQQPEVNGASYESMSQLLVLSNVAFQGKGESLES